MRKITQLIAASLIVFGLVLTTRASDMPHIRSVEQDSIGLLRKAIAQYPDSLELHVQFLGKIGVESLTAAKQYKKWLTKYKKSVVVPYAYGAALMNKYDHNAEKWLNEAIKRKPEYAPALYDLSLYAEFSGDEEKSTDYLRRAVEADPHDANYSFYYSNRHHKKDLQLYKKSTLEFISKFPRHQRAAQALFYLAHRSPDLQEKISLYEQLLKEYPLGEYSWTSAAMPEYFNLLMDVDTKKAEELAQKMKETSSGPNGEYWVTNEVFSQQIANVKELLQQDKGVEAAEILKNVKPQRGAMKELVALLAVETIAAQGQIKGAYDSLINMYTKTPIKTYYKELTKYGEQLGKDEQQIAKDAKSVLAHKAIPATPFALEQYYSSNKLSLSDLKGKVILLTYWYPGCGPCRAEFPHFENVLSKYNKEQIVYLGINIVRKQDEFVLPFMQESKCTFIPLKEEDGREKGNLDNGRVAPVNFLIDKDGKIAFSRFMINGNNEDMLEEMISLLL